MITWKVDEVDNCHYAYDGEKPIAYIYFLGGFCERPDAWYVRYVDDRSYMGEFSDLRMAKESVEDRDAFRH